jgi:hypothetical protein
MSVLLNEANQAGMPAWLVVNERLFWRPLAPLAAAGETAAALDAHL